MSEYKNKRVGAILWSDTEKKEIHFLGYGVHQGSEVPPASVSTRLARDKQTNPKIILDSGETVWGCQCWWGEEEHIKSALEIAKTEGYTITNVKMPELDPNDETLTFLRIMQGGAL